MQVKAILSHACQSHNHCSHALNVPHSQYFQEQSSSVALKVLNGALARTEGERLASSTYEALNSVIWCHVGGCPQHVPGFTPFLVSGTPVEQHDPITKEANYTDKEEPNNSEL